MKKTTVEEKQKQDTEARQILMQSPEDVAAKQKEVEAITNQVMTAIKTGQPQKSVSDLVGGSQFYPDLKQIALSDIAEVTHSLLDAAVLEDIEGDYGTHDAALLLLEDLITGEQYTTICSGMVVLKKVRKLIELKPWPILATITKRGRYWDIT